MQAYTYINDGKTNWPNLSLRKHRVRSAGGRFQYITNGTTPAFLAYVITHARHRKAKSSSNTNVERSKRRLAVRPAVPPVSLNSLLAASFLMSCCNTMQSASRGEWAGEN